MIPTKTLITKFRKKIKKIVIYVIPKNSVYEKCLQKSKKVAYFDSFEIQNPDSVRVKD